MKTVWAVLLASTVAAGQDVVQKGEGNVTSGWSGNSANIRLSQNDGVIEKINSTGIVTITGNDNRIQHIHASKVLIIGLDNVLTDVSGYKDGIYKRLPIHVPAKDKP